MKKCLVVFIALLVLLEAVVIVGVREHKEIVSSKEEKIEVEEPIVKFLMNTNYPSDTIPEVDRKLVNNVSPQTVLTNEIVELPAGDWLMSDGTGVEYFGNNIVSFNYAGNYVLVDNLESPKEILEIISNVHLIF